ncbi:TRAP transporter large permease subunit, partial [Chloroflexota bacterium]
RYLIMSAILLFYIPTGCLMDLLSAWMITLPIFYPIIQSLGFDIIWFLVLMEIVGELGLITPPVGLNVFIIQGITGLPTQKIFSGTMPFYVADVVTLIIIILVPSIVLFLPSLMG